MMTITEAVILVQNGDNAGFDVIYDSLKNKKLGLIRKYIMDDELAIDVLQESFITAWKKIKTLDNPESFEAWFSQICVRTAINALEQKKHKALDMTISFPENEEDSDDYELYDLNTSSWENTPELAYTETEIRELAYELINSLSDDQRFVVLMKDIEGMTTREIADILGCPEGTVKSRHRAGIKKLTEKAEELKKKGYKIFVLPLALLLGVLKKENEIYACEVATKEMLDTCKASIAKELGLNGVSGNAMMTGKKVRGTFLSSVKGKAIVATVGILIAGSIATAGFIIHKNESQEISDTIEAEPENVSDEQKMTTSEADTIEEKYLLTSDIYREFGNTDITTYEYDEYGHCTKSVTDYQSGDIYEIDYNWDGNLLVSSEKYSNGEKTGSSEYIYEEETEYLLQRKDYDADGNMTQLNEYIPEESKVSSNDILDYNYHESLRTTYDNGEIYSKEMYDVNGVCYHSETISDGETVVTQELALDEGRRVTSGCNYVRNNDEWEENCVFTYEYDEFGRILRQTTTSDFNGTSVSEYTYDENGNCVLCVQSGPEGVYQEISYEYDENGNRTLEVYTDPTYGIFDTYETKYDENGNKIYYCGYESDGEKHIEIEYKYERVQF